MSAGFFSPLRVRCFCLSLSNQVVPQRLVVCRSSSYSNSPSDPLEGVLTPDSIPTIEIVKLNRLDKYKNTKFLASAPSIVVSVWAEKKGLAVDDVLKFGRRFGVDFFRMGSQVRAYEVQLEEALVLEVNRQILVKRRAALLREMRRQERLMKGADE